MKKDLKKQSVEGMNRADIRATLEIFYTAPKIEITTENGNTNMSGEEFKLLLQRNMAFLMEDISAYGVKLV